MTTEQQRIKAAELMGWRLDRSMDYDAFYRPGGAYAGGATHDFARAIENACVPAYDTDANAALELCKMGNWTIKNSSKGWIAVVFFEGTARLHIAETAPLAILGAFLRCHGIDPEAKLP